MADVLQHIGLVFFYVLLLALDVCIFLGLPGGWVAYGAIFVYDALTGFSTVGWKWLAVMAAVMVVAEVVEALLGLVYVAAKGATRRGVLGAFLGGLLGAVAGTFIIPFVGSIVFGLAGAFALAVLFEYQYYRSMDRALQTGFFAFIGKLMAMFAKFALALANVGIFMYLSWG